MEQLEGMETLASLISQGEHVRQDFKFRIDDQGKIARTLCAFANTEGGRLLIGVKDNRKIAGCNPEEEFHMIEGAATLFCQPSVYFKHKIWKEDFKLVLEISVDKSIVGPHKSKDEKGFWKSYVRVKDHTMVAGKILEGVWKEKKKNHSRPEKFTEVETAFLRLISEQGPISLSKMYKLSGLSYRNTDRLLVLFISWGIVTYVHDNNTLLFQSAEETNHSNS
ncbi:MAG: hypothetical protein RIT43_1087 [Bacteroidota bacterium]|jgi:predicted HTH transcriptional regulator